MSIMPQELRDESGCTETMLLTKNNLERALMARIMDGPADYPLWPVPYMCVTVQIQNLVHHQAFGLPFKLPMQNPIHAVAAALLLQPHCITQLSTVFCAAIRNGEFDKIRTESDQSFVAAAAAVAGLAATSGRPPCSELRGPARTGSPWSCCWLSARSWL